MAFEKGVSGNAAGRPKGIVDRRRRMAQTFAGEFDAVASAVVEKAKAGDVAAAALYLSRVDPPLKPKAERVRFALDTSLPVARQAAQVVQAVANGDLDAESAQLVLSCLATYVALVQADQVEARLAELEIATAAQRPRGGVVQIPTVI